MRSSFSTCRRSTSANDDLDRRGRLGLAALDLLRERLLSPPQPFRDVLDHPPALAGMCLELLERLGDGRLRRALELLTQAQHRGALLVGGCDELLRLALDARLGLGDDGALPLFELAELRLEVLLRALEVGRPRAQSLLDPAFGGRELVGELVAGRPLPRHELLPALLGDAALLLRRAGTSSRPVPVPATAAAPLRVRPSPVDDLGDRAARPVEDGIGVACAAAGTREQGGGDS